jgi:hypothetical protein
MILLLEPNMRIRKRLCDILNRERIIGIDSYPQALEMIAKFKNNIDIFIGNIRLLNDILSRDTLDRLCNKLYIDMPPIVVIYRKGDEKISQQFREKYPSYKIIKFDGEDTGFPDRYIAAIREVYPGLIVDEAKANEVWLKGEESSMSFEEVRKWLVGEGLIASKELKQFGKIASDMQKVMPLINKMLSTAEEKKTDKDSRIKDYKSKYNELKKKYDLLVTYIKELARSTKPE